MERYNILLIVSYIVLINFGRGSCNHFDSLNRSKRTLLFPPTTPTRVQFICGIGIPVEDLAFESVTTGYVLKAEYYLPTKAEEWHPAQIMPQPVRKRSVYNYLNDTYVGLKDKNYNEDTEHFTKKLKQRHNDLSKYRWSIYKAMAMFADSIGYVGRMCVLRSICEVAATPFHYDGGILAELLHIIMTPSSSVDHIVIHSNHEFIQAERLGKSGAPCEHIFRECPVSLVSKFSSVVEITHNLLRIW